MPSGLAVESVVEPAPRGTGGAVRFALAALGHEGPFLVANGDTYLDQGLVAVATAAPEATAQIGLVAVADAARYGLVETDAAGRVVGFAEKGRAGPGRINAGLYRLTPDCLAPDRLEHAETETFSLERDVLPGLEAMRTDHPAAERVRGILFHRAFPVDVRHNAKIHRGELKRWAQRRAR